MIKDSKKKILSPTVQYGVTGALVGLGMLPTHAQAVLDVSQALDTPAPPPSDADSLDAKSVSPSVAVKTRDVTWDVPWIESAASESVEPAIAPVVEPQLIEAFAEEAEITQVAQIDFPLVEVSAQAQDDWVEPDIDSSEVSYPELETSQALYQPEAPLIALGEKESGEEEIVTTAAPLVAIAPEEQPANSILARVSDEKEFEAVSPLLASAPSQTTTSFPRQDKAPWLAYSLNNQAVTADTSGSETNVETAEDLAVNPLLALRSLEPDQPANKLNEPWLAIANEVPAEQNIAEDENSPWVAVLADEGNEKAPWLARSNNSNSQVQENPEAPRLAINLPRRDANKRPSPWISLTPIELMTPDEGAVALSPAASENVERYDVSRLQQVAITPADLAESGEIAVSVAAEEIEFLAPEPGAFLDIPATPVVLRFPIGANIALLTNGQVVDSSLVGRTETDSATQLRTQTWYGVPLISGENLLEVISTETGEVLRSLPLSVRGKPDRLVLLSPRAIPANGRSTASIRGQLIDETGNISRWNSVATVQASDGRFLGADHDPDVPGFQVEIQRGEFVAELQSSLESHLVQVQASASGFNAFSQLRFETPQRPDLVSGVIDLRLGASGTDFYDSYREFLPIDGDGGYEFDVDAAVFATGNIGEWLYTGAYNSDRTLNEDCSGNSALFRASASNCTNIYPTYGDDSYSDVVAPSLDSVYLRLERNSPSSLGTDYAMWGDYNTEEFATPAQIFTATNRQLHGFKANYNFGDFAVTGLYANNVEGFQRDTIAPDGTSGFYFTSQRDVIPGSENVYLELEELERPGTVLERRELARGIDYEIDYDRGTLLFNDPVTRTAVDDFGQLLVRRIVTTYQHEDGSDTDILAGRLQYNLSREQGQESWIGASYFAEDQGSRDFSLYGADARIALGENANITAEFAQSSNEFDTAGDVDGTAYRVEAEGTAGRFNGRAFYRSTDAGFSNAATTSFVPGQTRYGAQLSGRLTDSTTVRAQFDHEDNNGVAPRITTGLSTLLDGLSEPLAGTPVDNSLTTYSVGLSQRIGRSTAEVDWIHRDRSDRLNDDRDVSSDQIRSRLTTPLTNKLTLVAQNELNLSSNVDPIYPSRTLIGLNWEAMPWLNVGVNQIFYGGGGNNRGSVTSVDVTGEHTFASDTTVRGRFSTIDGRQIGGTIGLEQGIKLAPGLHLDLGYERVFSTFGNETAASTQFSQPVASGSTASSLGLAGGESYSIGLSYTDNPDFQASTRFEHRNASQGSNTVFDISALGRVTPALTLLGDYRLAHTANQNLSGLGTTSLLKLGLAYRDPKDDRFNALLRYEHRMNPNSIPVSGNLGTSSDTQEHLFSAEAIYAPNWRWELYGKYALRNSRTEISTADNNFSSNGTVQLAQARATYRLGYRWDVVGEARWLGGSGYDEVGYSVEAGYYPLPDLRLSAGYSGGAADRDFGENRNSGGFYVGATAKLSGLLNGFGTQPRGGFGTQPNDPQQQTESVLEVSQTPTGIPSSALLEVQASSEESFEAESEERASEAKRSPANEDFPAAVEL